MPARRDAFLKRVEVSVFTPGGPTGRPLSIAAIPPKYHLIYNLNPLTWILNEFRWSLLDLPAPPTWQIVMSIILPVVVFLGGAIIFEQMERGFADVI